MRNHTGELDIESPSKVSRLGSSAKAVNPAPVDLHDVRVYALGVDGAGQTTVHWQGLEEFWKVYFREARARFDSFSVLRELPAEQVR
jgi:hypothetical protein